MLSPEEGDRRFTFAFTGHSNVAGHGNYFDQTYPFVMARALSSLFHDAGVHLAVQNFAVGGGSSVPYFSYCARDVMGPEVDVASWDTAMVESGKSEKQGEAFVRGVLALPHPPAAVLVMDGRTRAPRWGSIYSERAWFVSMDHPEQGFDLANNKTRIEALRWLHPDCRQIAPNGTPKSVACRKEKWLTAGDEMEWRIGRKGLLEAGVYVNGRKIGGSCPGMNPWHDGYKLHLMKGNLLAHFFSRVVTAAVTPLLQAVSSAGSDAQVWQVLQEALQDAQGSMRLSRALPAPGGDCRSTGLCSETESLVCSSATTPRVEPQLRALDGNGNVLTATIDQSNGRKEGEEQRCHMGFIDFKYSIAVEKRHGWTKFSLPGLDASSPSVMVCEPATGWRRDERMALFDSDAETSWRLSCGGSSRPLKSPTLMDTGKTCYSWVEVKRPKGSGGDDEGCALEVQVKDSAKTARLSHVIWQGGAM